MADKVHGSPVTLIARDRRTGGLQRVMARAGGKLAVRNTKSMKKVDGAAFM